MWLAIVLLIVLVAGAHAEGQQVYPAIQAQSPAGNQGAEWPRTPTRVDPAVWPDLFKGPVENSQHVCFGLTLEPGVSALTFKYEVHFQPGARSRIAIDREEPSDSRVSQSVRSGSLQLGPGKHDLEIAVQQAVGLVRLQAMVNNGVEDLPGHLTDCSGSPLNSKNVWETPPKLLYKVEWTPGEQFRKAGLHEGRVVLSFEVGLDGLAHGVNVVNGLGKGIDERAIDAIEKFRFQPATLNGRPLVVRIEVEFHHTGF